MPVITIAIALGVIAFVLEAAGLGVGRVRQLVVIRRCKFEGDRLQRRTDQLRREIVEINARADLAEQQAQVLCAASAGPSFGPTAMLLLSSGESHTEPFSTEALTMTTFEEFATKFNVAPDTTGEARLAVVIDVCHQLQLTIEARDRTIIESTLAELYRNGQLLHGRDDNGGALPSPREDRLRRIAREDGLSALEAELREMPQIAQLNHRVVIDEDHRGSK